MDQKQFNAERFQLIGLPPLDTYAHRKDDREKFEQTFRPLLEAFGERKLPEIKGGEYQHLPLWIFDDYLLAEALNETYKSPGVSLNTLKDELKKHSKKLERAKLNALKAVESLITLTVDGPDKTKLKQAHEIINSSVTQQVIQPVYKELFFSALVCLSFHYCFDLKDFKPRVDSKALKPIARIVAVFYGEELACKHLNSISSKIKNNGNVAQVLNSIISEHLGLWGQFLMRNV